MPQSPQDRQQIQADIEALRKQQGMSEVDAIKEAYRRYGQKTKEAALAGNVTEPKKTTTPTPAATTPKPAPKKAKKPVEQEY